MLKILNISLLSSVIFYSLRTITLSTAYVDSFLRVQLSDSVPNLFYFFWTQFFYLPFFIILLFYVIYIFASTKIELVTIFIIYVLAYLYYYSIMTYHSLNLANYEILNHSLFNTLLLNPINKYHPFLFYMSTILLILVKTLPVNVNKMFYYKYCYKTKLKTTSIGILTLTLTLYLGSWWAAQEGSWGGWWNWDSSEVFGLIILVTSFIYIHNTSDKDYLVIGFSNLTKVLVIIFVYLFVQLNFDLISHNFGIRDTGILTFNNYLPFLLGSIICILKFFFVKIRKVTANLLVLKKQTFFKRNYFITNKYLALYLFIVSVVLLSLPSFYPLINNLVWQYLSINIFNNLYSEKYILSIVYITILAYLFRISVLFINLYLTVPFVYLPVNLFPNVKRSWVSFWHIIIFLLTLMTFIYFIPTFATVTTNLNLPHQEVQIHVNTFYSLNFLDYTVTSSAQTQVFNKNLDLLTYKSSVSVGSPLQTFLNISHLYDINQILKNGTALYPYLVKLFDTSSEQVNGMFSLIIIMGFYYLLFKLKIIF